MSPNRRLILLFLTLPSTILVFSLAGVGAAIAEGEYVQTGPYVGAAFAYGWENFEGSSSFAMSPGFDARLGWRVTEIFSFELEGEFMNEFSTRSLEVLSHDVRIWSIGGNLKANANLERVSWLARVQPFGLLGFGFYGSKEEITLPGIIPTFKNDHYDAMAKIGGGVDVYITPHILLTVDARYNFIFRGNTGLDYISATAGAAYRF
jgi:hypothetical protein